MIIKMKLNKLAVIDGAIRAAALFILTDFVTSAYFTVFASRCSAHLIFAALLSAVIALGLSLSLAFINHRKCRYDFHLWRYFLMSLAAFVVVRLLALINMFTLHLRLFPIRELSNVDGIIILIVLNSFLIAGLLGRVVAFMSIWIKQSKTGA